MIVSQNELKPLRECPFCGGDTIHATNDGGGSVHWHKCIGCNSEGPISRSPSDARDKWNTRATSPAERQIEAIRAAMATLEADLKETKFDDTRYTLLRFFKNDLKKILEEGK